MTPEDRRALRIARDALELDGLQRNVFVAHECSDENELRRRVEAILRRIDHIESEGRASDSSRE
jgi:hypothetical protein